MEKNDPSRPNYVSKLILGQLYDAVDCYKYYKAMVKIDHENAICKKYYINSALLGLNNLN